jgi:surface protein
MIISKLEKIKETKNRLKEVINAKGGTITDSTPFSEYPDKLDEIDEPQTAKEYYKNNRPKNWPYFPLPSEMTEEDDVIYLLYDATDFRCCPAFSASFTSCTCTLYKYMDTEVVSEEILSLTSDTTMYLQYDDSQENYNTFNYVLIKLQGSITKIGTYKSKFNGVTDTSGYVSELIEISGKCNACVITNPKFHPHIKYYSFLGVSSTSTVNMFSDCRTLQAIPDLDTSNVTKMSGMFSGCNSLKTIPLLDTSKVTDMYNMFYHCNSLHTIPLLDTSHVTNMGSMFSSCYSLQTIPELNTSNVTSMSSMFYNCYSLQTIPLLNTSNVTTMDMLFSGCSFLQAVPELDTSKVVSMNSMFYYCRSLQTIPLLDTSNVKNMKQMFYYCYPLQAIPELDTSNVTNMSGMFNACYHLQSIPELNTNNVTDMSSMFYSCRSLQTIPELNTSNVTNMGSMFQTCSSLQRIHILNPAVSFSISSSNMFQREDLLTILNNLATVTTTQTLTMGSTNLAKLTDADKLIATEKGWTLA